MPDVSVLTPIYNTDPTILKITIESILNQSFKNFEFIILNDSPENGEIEEIVRSYNDPRIRYLKNKKNLGISESRNVLLHASRGKYIAILDHDDISKVNRLEKQFQYLENNPFIGVVGCWIKVKGNSVDRTIRYPIENMDIKRKMMSDLCIPHSGCMIRKAVMIENDICWEKNSFPAEDYLLMIRLMQYTMFHNIPEELLIYRKHASNTGDAASDKMADSAALIRCIAEKEYPYLLRKTKWILLFNCIPFIQIRQRSGDMRYFLFGYIPIFRIK